MRATALFRGLASAVSVALAGCATQGDVAVPPDRPARTQALRVVTDPPGAACDAVQGGYAAGSVASTPGEISVRRDYCYGAPASRPPPYCGPWNGQWTLAPVVVTCRKDGYLDQQQTLVAVDSSLVESEKEEHSELSPARDMAKAMGMAGMFMGPVGLVLVLPALAGLAATQPDPSELTSTSYAYRGLETFVLVPASLPRGAGCDAFFAEHEQKLRRVADERHAFINRQCVFWPCKAGDPVPCAHDACLGRHKRVDEELQARLEALPAQRAQFCTRGE